jgi:GAF domain
MESKSALYNFIINSITKDEEELLRLRLLISLALLEIGFCLICIAFHSYLGFNTPKLLFLLPIALMVGTLFLIRGGVLIKAAKHIIILNFWVSFCVGMYFSGGLYSLVTPWLALLPLIAFGLIDRKSANLWFFISFFTLSIFAFFQNELMDKVADKRIFGILLAHLGLVAMIFLFMRLFHKTESSLLTTVKAKNEFLLEQQEEILRQNKRLREQSIDIENANKQLAILVESAFDRNRTLERHWNTLLEVSKSKSVNFGDLQEALRYITKTAALSLHIDRVSIWHYNKEKGSIQSLMLYKRSDDSYESGEELLHNDFPAYFDALMEETAIPADDTELSPTVAELRDSYLRPLHILSMLDAPFFLEGKLGGVICCEHMEQRHWLPEDIIFARALSDIVTLVFKVAQRRKYESKIRNHKNEIARINQSLEDRIKERTATLETQNEKLAEYAFINSHVLRAPLCRILGLINLLEETEVNTKEHQLLSYLKTSGEELDEVVKGINKIIENGIPTKNIPMQP